MRILAWHVHGSYTTSLVASPHTWLLPVTADRGPDGRGRARTWDWPDTAVEVTREECAAADVDVVVLQRPSELHGLARQWLGGRVPGRDVPAVYLEHNAPQGRIADMRHPAADRPDLTVVHVTHFNDLLWDTGSTPTRVVEHGVVDPGRRYTGDLPRQAVVVNEPVRRGRVTGTDLLAAFADAAPLDVFGMGVEGLCDAAGLGRARHDVGLHDDVPQHDLHDRMARRRVYVHPIRWTSLGLSLIEAMLLGMPVVAVGSTEVWEAVPPEAGVVSTRLDRLVAAVRDLVHEPLRAEEMGRRARRAALSRFGIARFTADWDALLKEVAA